MITFPMLPGVEINIVLILFLGLVIGVISGFTGVGGGFIISPALIIMGFPAEYAVGTSLIWVMGNSIVGALRHRQLGNVDMRLAFSLMIFVMGGIEAGVKILDWTKDLGLVDEAVLIISIVVLFIVGGYTFFESIRTKKRLDGLMQYKGVLVSDAERSSLSSMAQRIRIRPVISFHKSGVKVSLWALLIIGLGVGILSGFTGAGGGFIMVPSMVYLLEVPSFIAVGTNLFQVIFSAAFGSIQHTISGNVIIYAAFIMLLGSSIGVQFGALATKYLRGICMGYVLAATIFIAILGSLIKLIALFIHYTGPWLEYGTLVVMLGGLGLVLFMILALFTAALRYKKGNYVPTWIISMLNC